MEETTKVNKFAELDAIKKIATVLEPLTVMAQDRVFGYLNHWMMEKRNPSPRVSDLARHLRSVPQGYTPEEQAKMDAQRTGLGTTEQAPQ